MELFVLIIIFIILSILEAHFKSAGHKGRVGEARVNNYIRKSLDQNIYFLIEDVTLPTRNGTTQIDHIIVSVYGIFVIETKNISGWIFGNERQRTWTQVIYKRKHKLLNPLRQNYAHVKTIQSLLRLRQHQIFSIIALVGDCVVKTDFPENVTQGRNFIAYIKSMDKPVISERDVKNAINVIEATRLERSKETNRIHINNINNN